MNPIRSYENFLDYMRYSGENTECIVPVVLIRPGTVMRLNERRDMDDFFDYFDERTGDVTFFLPGYSYTPGTRISQLIRKITRGSGPKSIFKIQRLGDIDASNHDFVEFISTLESQNPRFHYQGNTELLLLRYIPGADYGRGSFDFYHLHRYDLTMILMRQGRSGLMRFLESVLRDYRRCSGGMDVMDSADLYYNDMLRGEQ